ncbi:ABC transporter ATP-binding protein [Mycoplasmopsis iners]|uniref:ABC transporter ATP-binding protein n=1 Tax=Mycoplasmopsis iners TaxID=76630 RepID=UPI00055A08FA|nr:ABC transporter ATP-binding protein [Mycoplasmopsis iners]
MPRFNGMVFGKNKDKLKLRDFFQFLKRFRINPLAWIIMFFIGALIPLASTLASLLIGYMADYFFDAQILQKGAFEFKYFALCVAGLAFCYILNKVLTLIQRRFFDKAIIDMIFELRIETYQKIQKMPLSYFSEQKIGNLMSNLTNDINNIMQALIDMLTNFIVVIFQFVIIFIILFIYAPILAAIAIVTIPLSTYILYLFIKNNQKYFIKQQESLGDFNAFLEEVLEAMPLVRIHKQQDKISKMFDKYNEALIAPDYKSARNIGFTYPFIHFSKFANLLIIISVGCYLIFSNISGGGIQPLKPGLLITFSIYILNLADTTSQILEITSNVQLGLGGIARIQKILALKHKEEAKLNELDYKKGKIEFKNVNFAYPSFPEKTVLHNINFTIEPGQTIALVGKTGSGKTTIAKLLSQFYSPTSGQVLIDDQPSETISEKSWRNYMDTILQDVFVFEATLRDNLTLFNKDISDEKIYEIVEKVVGIDFIKQMPKGLDTFLKSNAKQLSQGQKQLISIIRALISARPIIILDEATSDIDTITEQRIKNTMDYLINNCSSLVIAHRLSTIINADKILVIDNGQIIESGTHQELMKKEGYYFKLYNTGFQE